MVGAAAGHAYDHLRQPTADDSGATPEVEHADRSAREAAFGVAIVVLGAKMAKADGAVSRAEVKAFKTVFRVPPDEVKNVARIFDAAKRDSTGFEPYARQVASMFRSDPAILEELLVGLFHIAWADGPGQAAELDYLRRVAVIFGFGPQTFARILTQFQQPDAVDPYEVLGVDRTVTDAEVKTVYRKLIRENHPDTLVAKGMPQDFIDLANERMASINAAYDQIEKERGLK
jgi:DnaJ like chaperone protein